MHEQIQRERSLSMSEERHTPKVVNSTKQSGLTNESSKTQGKKLDKYSDFLCGLAARITRELVARCETNRLHA